MIVAPICHHILEADRDFGQHEYHSAQHLHAIELLEEMDERLTPEKSMAHSKSIRYLGFLPQILRRLRDTRSSSCLALIQRLSAGSARVGSTVEEQHPIGVKNDGWN